MTPEDIRFELSIRTCVVCDGTGKYESYDISADQPKLRRCLTCCGTGWRHKEKYVLIKEDSKDETCG